MNTSDALHDEMILILDFGSQYTQLIARRIRELHVYCEIVPFNKDISGYDPASIKGFVLSGGPCSVKDDNAPKLPESFYDTDTPILGICYGMQLIAEQFGARLERATHREYGHARLKVSATGDIFTDIAESSQAWMSHGDSILSLPEGFELAASTDSLPFAAMINRERKIYGVQFHPEVSHTAEGKKILENFVSDICGCSGSWTEESFIEATVEKIRQQVGDGQVALGISGGVDSSVAAMLLHRAIGERSHPIFVNNGLLRKNEFHSVLRMFSEHGIKVEGVDASQLFLERLAGVVDPEQKRKIIGNTFIDVFEEQAAKIGGVEFLGQGTLYPDVIESVSFKGGPSVTIKSHHNVGGLKAQMKLKLVEPLRELFKDEVRSVGKALGLPEKFLGRHPFPGPGLAVRVLGEITEERLHILREADEIYINELYETGQYDQIWQAFAVLLPVQTVGVMGDERTYENVIALRAVTSTDGMTADWAHIPYDILARISNKIINNVRGV
ncbi:MAG TPA: glutamine-hydrolyzing GMP synthase, partial [candidate division Zixibacteria bacterium]|nr:glutamine-hydrolyzing GMP synthase [candidate division Zixibacteria bacterium]